MKAFLIDAKERQIREIDYSGNWEGIHTLIGCDTFDVATFSADGDGVYIDDEGLLTSPEHFFLIDGYPTPLAGNGLVLGCDEYGNSISPKITLEELALSVKWMTPQEAYRYAMENDL